MESHEKFQKDTHYKIEQHAERCNLDSATQESAINLYDAFHSPANSNARSSDTYAIAAIYLAHRVRGEPASISQLVNGTTLNETYVNRAYRSMVDQLQSQIDLKAFTPEDFIGDYADKLDLSDTIIERALEIHRSTKDITQNYASSTRAATALYLACQKEGKAGRGEDRITQKDLARVSGVTEVTIRNRAKELAPSA